MFLSFDTVWDIDRIFLFSFSFFVGIINISFLYWLLNIFYMNFDMTLSIHDYHILCQTDRRFKFLFKFFQSLIIYSIPLHFGQEIEVDDFPTFRRSVQISSAHFSRFGRSKAASQRMISLFEFVLEISRTILL